MTSKTTTKTSKGSGFIWVVIGVLVLTFGLLFKPSFPCDSGEYHHTSYLIEEELGIAIGQQYNGVRCEFFAIAVFHNGVNISEVQQNSPSIKIASYFNETIGKRDFSMLVWDSDLYQRARANGLTKMEEDPAKKTGYLVVVEFK